MKCRKNYYSGYLVIGRYTPHADWLNPDSMLRNQQVHLTLGDFVSRFKGLFGDMWLDTLNSNPPSKYGELLGSNDYEKAKKFYDKYSEAVKRDLVYIRDCTDFFLPDIVKEKFFFCGYEIGMFNCIGSYWSSITNEVVNGTLSELTDYAKNLNEYFLLSDIDVANQLAGIRQKLCDTGHRGKTLEDIESMTDGEPCHILEIHCLK